MKHIKWSNVLIILALLAACVPGGEGGFGLPTSTLPPPQVRVTRAPDAASAMRAYLDAYAEDDYVAMYAMLTEASRQAISEEDFVNRHSRALDAMALKEMRYTIQSTSTAPQSAQVNYTLVYVSNVVGEISSDVIANLNLDQGQWRISWDESLILSDLRGGNILSMDYSVPERGSILDRDGDPLVARTDAVALGLIPGQIFPDAEEALLSELSRLTGLNRETIRDKYRFAGADWYIPVGEVSLEEISNRYGVLSSYSGLVFSEYNSRYYYGGGLASQTIGYTSSIPAERREEYIRAGYSPDARVGQAGIEVWGEQYLAGQTGGTLYVVSPEGSIIKFIGERKTAQPASNLYLTIDRDFQAQVQRAMLESFSGSIVVLERDTGRVLAMVSSPGYDPNIFDPRNANSTNGLTALFQSTDTPLLNRATQGQYPLGSVFKIITMAAALESGTFTADNQYNCQYEWTELPGRIFYDWTYERFQRELRETGQGVTQPSGVLTLQEGLMRSCNPWFYHIGLTLYNQGYTTLVADTARGFGLGSPTGIGQIAEASGNINNPPEVTEAVNQAIGQGDMLVTPLQVATFIAAIGNGGTLYRPQIVEKVVGADGIETVLFSPEERGTLPISEENLLLLQQAMRMVVADPRGTAYRRFTTTDLPIYGKTGTAEVPPNLPHAWFAGYTDAVESTGLPDIAIVVLVENKGEGSDYGAPIFKRVIEIYYQGRPINLYWFESSFGITETPTLPVTPTLGP